MNRLTRVLLAGFLVAAGLFVTLWWGPAAIGVARGSADWPTTPGVIEAVEVSSQKGRRTSRVWYADLRYRYTVDGKDYVGDDYDAYGDARGSSETGIREFAARHPPGTEVVVHYDPEDPEVAVLRTGGEEDLWGHVGFGALIAVVGAYLLVRELRRRG